VGPGPQGRVLQMVRGTLERPLGRLVVGDADLLDEPAVEDHGSQGLQRVEHAAPLGRDAAGPGHAAREQQGFELGQRGAVLLLQQGCEGLDHGLAGAPLGQPRGFDLIARKACGLDGEAAVRVAQRQGRVGHRLGWRGDRRGCLAAGAGRQRQRQRQCSRRAGAEGAPASAMPRARQQPGRRGGRCHRRRTVGQGRHQPLVARAWSRSARTCAWLRLTPSYWRSTVLRTLSGRAVSMALRYAASALSSPRSASSRMARSV